MFILGNTLTADMGLIPGYAIIGPLFGLPLSVMAAVIERPFWTAAGLKHHTVWYSIQANVVSLLLGYPIVFVVGALGPPAWVFWPFASVLVSTWIEWAYISFRGAAGRQFSFGWGLGGNAVSALACFLLLCPVHALDRPWLKEALRPYQLSLSIVLGIFCFVAVIAAFIVPRRKPVSPANAARPVAASAHGPAVGP